MPTVFVMMSGGVDSSVACASLVKQGYQVVGVFMKCWSRESLQKLGLSEELYACSWEEDLEDAKIVAKKLNIPFEVWDFQREYLEAVVQYMLTEYRHGRTPNPDVMCNGQIKFGIFYNQALARGANFVATGHYARTNGRAILRALDTNKDQTYFLWQIRTEQIPQILFPIGEFESKQKVREAAKNWDLPVFAKPDSQGLCFIGQTTLRDLLIATFGTQEGDILDIYTGQVLGRHPGACLYTIGQREKLGLSGGPWFVCKIDVTTNQVWVTHQHQEQILYTQELIAEELNWQQQPDTTKPLVCQAQTRYRQLAVNCRVYFNPDKTVKVVFQEPVRAVTPGQSVVFYKDDELLGGGVIR